MPSRVAHSAPTALNLPHNAFVHPEALREKKNAQKRCVCSVCVCAFAGVRVFAMMVRFCPHAWASAGKPCCLNFNMQPTPTFIFHLHLHANLHNCRKDAGRGTSGNAAGMNTEETRSALRRCDHVWLCRLVMCVCTRLYVRVCMRVCACAAMRTVVHGW